MRYLYYIVEKNGGDFSTKEVRDESWFKDPIQKEGSQHQYMAEVHIHSHWKSSNLANLQTKDTTWIYVYTFGKRKEIELNGWSFKPEVTIRSALTNHFSGMEMSFQISSPDGQKGNWYYNSSASNHMEYIKKYFKEIYRISQYKTMEEARNHRDYDPSLKVW